ncbi:MAG: DUF4160 domain-containing protein [Blastocatellia bacterium]
MIGLSALPSCSSFLRGEFLFLESYNWRMTSCPASVSFTASQSIFITTTNRPPHFHAEYAEHEATFVIETLGYLSGALPGRARALVVEWALQHRDELRTDWELAKQGQPLLPIPPLD